MSAVLQNRSISVVAQALLVAIMMSLTWVLATQDCVDVFDTLTADLPEINDADCSIDCEALPSLPAHELITIARGSDGGGGIGGVGVIAMVVAALALAIRPFLKVTVRHACPALPTPLPWRVNNPGTAPPSV